MIICYDLALILFSYQMNEFFMVFQIKKGKKILDKPRNERAKLLEKPPEEILGLSSLAELDNNSFHNSHMER